MPNITNVNQQDAHYQERIAKLERAAGALREATRWLRDEQRQITFTPGSLIRCICYDGDGGGQSIKVIGACAIGYAAYQYDGTYDPDSETHDDPIDVLSCNSQVIEHTLHASMALFDSGRDQTVAEMFDYAADTLEAMAASAREQAAAFASYKNGEPPVAFITIDETVKVGDILCFAPKPELDLYAMPDEPAQPLNETTWTKFKGKVLAKA